MKIVHIGKGTTPDEIDSIIHLRDAGHDVYVPGDSTYEQLVRRIIDADEIHVWNADMVFELGMVYFFSVHALHYGLGWLVRVFCNPGPEDKLLPLFMPPQPEPEPELHEHVLLPPTAKFVPPCHSGVGPCKECGQQTECDELRKGQT